MKSAYLIQSLPVEGKGGLLEGGFTHTMTARELIEVLGTCHGIPRHEKFKVTGVGATESLGDEITYMGDKLYIVSGESGKIETRELDLDTKISFSQIALQSVEGLSKKVHFDKITAPNSDKEAHEINHGGAFGELLKAIGGESSAVVSVSAKTEYMKSRAVCPIVKETGKKISPAVGLKTMIMGGEINDEVSGTRTVTGQTILEQSFESPETIGMVGIITGQNMAENVPLKGLHVHCKYGHVLDLGELRDVDVEVTPIDKTFILLPERNKAGKQVWHTALQEEHLPSLTNFQQLTKAWLKRKEDPKSLSAIQEEVRSGKRDITTWAEHVTGRESRTLAM